MSGVDRDASVLWFILFGCRRKRGTMHREPQPEGRAARGKVLRGYGAAVRLHDGLDDRKTYPGAGPRSPRAFDAEHLSGSTALR